MSLENLRSAFRNNSSSVCSEFIDQNLHYASASAIFQYVESYLFDVLDEIVDKEYIADYLRNKGWEVNSPDKISIVEVEKADDEKAFEILKYLAIHRGEMIEEACKAMFEDREPDFKKIKKS